MTEANGGSIPLVLPMNEYIKKLHLEVGRKCGKDSTCGKKQAFKTEEKAIKAADHHNNWREKKNDVEPYPCFFCEMWHIGKIMPTEVLENILKEN